MVNRLEEQEARLKEDIGLYDSQLHNQSKKRPFIRVYGLYFYLRLLYSERK